MDDNIINNDVTVVQQLQENGTNRVYLVTYSQADEKKFPTRQSFGAAVVTAFGGRFVNYFCVGKEPHAAGGFHYHMSILLNTSRRWGYAKKYLMDNFDVAVNFSSSPNNGMYEGAYWYTTKQDKEYSQLQLS